MPYSQEHKQQSREKILKSAAGLFTEKGFDNTSIDEIMAHAGLTRGAFYAHFQKKSQLYAEAILYAARVSRISAPKPKQFSEQQWLDKLIQGYLNQGRSTKDNGGCPLAFLVTDVVNQDPYIRKTYTKVFKGMNQIIGSYGGSYSESYRGSGIDADREQAVLALTAMMIGGVAVGRALDDKAYTKKLIDGCIQTAQAILKS